MAFPLSNIGLYSGVNNSTLVLLKRILYFKLHLPMRMSSFFVYDTKQMFYIVVYYNLLKIIIMFLKPVLIQATQIKVDACHYLYRRTHLDVE